MSDTTETPVEQTVAINLDGRRIEARPGELVIDAAERHGTYIPRFCYHPRMAPVGMCRMCIVEIDAGRGAALQPSCMIPVAEGMTVSTESPVTKKAQDGVLEFLLANHPLDCPVCDKGGECPLQDQAYAYGPGESRFVEEKRHFEKPIPISPTVNLDRERCILCDRCTRFAKEVAGDPLIHFIDRGNQTQVNTFPDHPFASYFSGNTVQICPVGALTAEPYRFKARPWDLDQVESTCTSCSVGCRVVVQATRNRVARYQGVDIDPVNWSWMCDKGRFDHESVNAEERLSHPLVRDGATQSPTSWAAALSQSAAAIRTALDRSGPDGVAVIGGARLTNESAYAWAKLAKGVIGTDHVDCQLGDGLPAEAVLGLPRATIDQACTPGGTIVLLGVDPKEELPVLFLRLRHALVHDRAALVEIVPAETGLTGLAAATVVYRPGEAHAVASALGDERPQGAGGASAEQLSDLRSRLTGDGPLTVIFGRGNLAEPGETVAAAAAALLAAFPRARFLPGLRRGNVFGALDAGLAPGILPGRVSLDDGREWFHDHWTTVPPARGRDTAGILQAAADAKLDVLVLLGADPLADFPDRALAQRALAGARTVIAVDTLPNESVRQAHIVLPAAGYAEVDGTTTNIEGRVSRLSQKVTAPGTARPDWIIAAELANRLGDDLGIESVLDALAELARVAPSHEGLAMDAIGLDGVVVPVGGLRPEPGVVTPGDTGAPAAASERQDASPEHGIDAVAAAAATDAHAADSGEERLASEAAATEAQAAEAQAAEAGAPTGEGYDDPAAIEGEASALRARHGAPGTLRYEPQPVSIPAPDSYTLRLVATRKLYDLGTLLQASPSLAGLAPGAALALHPHDFDRLGVEPGAPVRVSNREAGRGELTLPVTPSAGVPRGGARVWVNQPGGSVTELIDAGRPVTDVRVERA